MEDLDQPREMPGAADGILRTLHGYGFEWDGKIIYQSQRAEAYNNALDYLKQQQRVYPCACSRREIAALAHAGIEGPVYPGTCRNGLPENTTAQAWRIKVDNSHVHFSDLIQGNIQHQMRFDIGDFVLRRADGLFAYQIAVVVDDAEQGITHIVRGADLLNSTTRQILLQQRLSLSTPRYAHVPIAAHADGQKLSKQTRAKPVQIERAAETLNQVFLFLGMTPPADLAFSPLSEIWHWAIQNWQLGQVPKQRMIQL
jgi:glutamyl-Q tRNA(Asp) synthetase